MLRVYGIAYNDILLAMQKKLRARAAHLEMEFPFFRVKKAPVSGREHRPRGARIAEAIAA